MVSYFVPRGRFLLKSTNLRQPPKQGKWSIRWAFRRPLSNKTETIEPKLLQNQQPSLNLKTTAENLKTLPTKEYCDKNNNNNKKKSGWFTWTGILFRLTPIGFCFYSVLEWQLHKYKLKNESLPRTASQFQSNIYCLLPLRLISRCWGWLAECYVPSTLRPYIYGFYSNAFNVNIDEAKDSDFKNYRSLAEFFTRPLKDGVRCIDSTCCIVSPADGKILHFGSTSNALIEQVKGVTYKIDSFLGPDTWVVDNRSSDGHSYSENIKHNKSDDTALFQCVIYLAPGDYHRFHSPTHWEPEIRRHFPGELLSVSPKIAQWLPGLFCLNERAAYIGKWMHGFFSFTAVGATNVGSVQIYFDEKLRTNKWVGLKPKLGTLNTNTQYDELKLPVETKLDKGQLLGQFNMGSTVVLLFEAPKKFKFSVEAGQSIRVGEPLGIIDQ